MQNKPDLRLFALDSQVIPGNPGEGRGRPGIQEFQRNLDTGLRRYDG